MSIFKVISYEKVNSFVILENVFNDTNSLAMQVIRTRYNHKNGMQHDRDVQKFLFPDIKYSDEDPLLPAIEKRSVISRISGRRINAMISFKDILVELPRRHLEVFK